MGSGGPIACRARTGGSDSRQAAGGTGTTVRFNMNRDARVIFVIERALVGRERSGGRCTVTAYARKKGKRCIRWDYAGRFEYAGVKGGNTFRFSGRMKDGALPAGRYRLRGIAIGEIVDQAIVRFRISG